MAEILRGAWAAQPRRTDRRRLCLRLHGPAPFPPHHAAAAAAVGGARDRQPGDPDHQGQRLSHDHRAARADPCGELDPVAPLHPLRRLHHGGAAVLGPLSDGGGLVWPRSDASRRRGDDAAPPTACRPGAPGPDRLRRLEAFGSLSVLDDIICGCSAARRSVCSAHRARASRRCSDASTGWRNPTAGKCT